MKDLRLAQFSWKGERPKAGGGEGGLHGVGELDPPGEAVGDQAGLEFVHGGPFAGEDEFLAEVIDLGPVVGLAVVKGAEPGEILEVVGGVDPLAVEIEVGAEELGGE